jgi:Cu/Ag efflux pump CusA
MVTVSTCQHLEEQQGEDFGLPLVLRGAQERLVPILLAALTVGLALLPFLFFGNIPGHEIVRPVAIAILGGLVTSTFYTLFIVPALYLRFGASREADLGIVTVPASTEA